MVAIPRFLQDRLRSRTDYITAVKPLLSRISFLFMTCELKIPVDTSVPDSGLIGLSVLK